MTPKFKWPWVRRSTMELALCDTEHRFKSRIQKALDTELEKEREAKSKYAQVWCVVSPEGHPLAWTQSRAGRLAIEVFLPGGGDWDMWEACGYTVQKFYLVPVEESDGRE